MLRLISATPSPYARKARVLLHEKGIPFELVTDVPWNEDTVVRAHNPLEKLPILITEEDGTICDSTLICEYVELTWPAPPFYPAERMQRIRARAVETLANGVCDAFLLHFFETRRAAGRRSPEWTARQRRKIERGVAELSHLLGERDVYIPEFGYAIADIAAAVTVGYLSLRMPEFDWRTPHPNLARLLDRLSQRPSFAQTAPSPQTILGKVA